MRDDILLIVWMILRLLIGNKTRWKYKLISDFFKSQRLMHAYEYYRTTLYILSCFFKELKISQEMDSI